MHRMTATHRCLITGISALASLIIACAPTTHTARGGGGHVLAEQKWQLVEAERIYLQRESRINDLAWQLRTDTLDLCPNHIGRSIGMVIADTSALKPADRDMLVDVYGSKKGVLVTHVMKDGPASAAGIQKGDFITKIDGTVIPETRAAASYIRAITPQMRAEASGPVVIKLDRKGKPLTIEVKPQLVCTFPAILTREDSLNAYADGDRIYITTGMYRFAQSDQDLQAVIAHEFAHNSEGHLEKKMGNYLLGSILDVAAAVYGINTQGVFGQAGAGLYSKDFEREADYVGMYYLARSSIDTANVRSFWRRMAVEHPGGIREHYQSTHPSTAERWANLQAAHEEIVTKLETGAALLPERKTRIER
ncbi:MAG TPA: hypothetical protein DCZ13_08690 [Porticoccaceae bacterium]|nr:hypothetical protein [Porticoccaceae bacterium]